MSWRDAVRLPSARSAAFAAAVLALGTSPWWGRRVLAELSFFQLRHVEIRGATFLRPGDVMARLAVDTTMSVWEDLGTLERRVAAHPQVAGVSIARKLPGTLVVQVTENAPVALLATAAGFRALDARGTALPLEPSATAIDLPIIAQRDTAVLRLLVDVRRAYPALFERISDVRRQGRGELVVRLASFAVLTRSDVSADRFAELLPVESDLQRRQARVAEIDLRFRDQVIARLQ
jgi:cell division septal protein FtsQ